MTTPSIPFVDLFCGAGGLSAGFEQAGFRSVFANDNDSYACETYRENHPHSIVAEGDVEALTGREILERTGLSAIPLVIGGPNCQGVSLRGKRDPHDPKNKAFFAFRRLIEELQPEWFVMENVPGLLHRHNHGLVRDIYAEFDSIGYKCAGEVLCAADYGVPQIRYRFLLIGTRTGAPIFMPSPSHQIPGEVLPKQATFLPSSERLPWLTAQDAIGDLPPIPNGGGVEVRRYPELTQSVLSSFQLRMRAGSEVLYNHVAHRSSDLNIERIKHIAPGKNWKSIPEEIRPERFKRVALKDHTTTYGRLRWDMPARTITTYFNNISAGQFTHPDQHRGVSVREGARFQSFPDHFRFCGTLSRQYRQIGNAVPPLLAFHVAALLRRQILGDSVTPELGHPASVAFDSGHMMLRFDRPLQGMRFNLDRYLVRS